MKHNHDFGSIKTCEIRGRKFKVSWRSICTPVKGEPNAQLIINGQLDHSGRRLNICKRQAPFEVLMTTIHEFTHGAFFDLDEESVSEFEADLRRFLTRMGIQVTFTPKRRTTHHAKKSRKKTQRNRTKHFPRRR